VVRFGVEPTIGFPNGDLRALEMPDGGPAQMQVNFMGLTGPSGVLPYYYTLLAAEKQRGRNPALVEFLDLFHHRIISLFYRAWEKHRFTVTYERGKPDRLTEHVRDLVGLALEGYRNLLPVSDQALLFYSGLLGPHQRSASALEQMIGDFFDVPVEVQQFVGAWYPIARPTQCSLGMEQRASGQLGLGAVAGDEVWDQQARVRVRIGPLARADYERFLPTGSAYEPLRQLVRFFSDDQFDFELQLVLAKEAVPPCVLGGDEDRPLGWCTWMRSAPLAHDADQTILTL
jgi:type VI secretion system protein ImpH